MADIPGVSERSPFITELGSQYKHRFLGRCVYWVLATATVRVSTQCRQCCAWSKQLVLSATLLTSYTCSHRLHTRSFVDFLSALQEIQAPH